MSKQQRRFACGRLEELVRLRDEALDERRWASVPNLESEIVQLQDTLDADDRDRGWVS